jgi:hypothetical protein
MIYVYSLENSVDFFVEGKNLYQLSKLMHVQFEYTYGRGSQVDLLKSLVIFL